MAKSFIEHRPRLEPWPSQGVGPGPLSPFWRVEPDPEPPTEPLALLEHELDTFRAECRGAVRHAEDGIMPMGHNQIAWLNTRLAEVQRLNAEVTHPRHSSAVAGWPDPVVPTNIICGPRELLPLLSDALRALANVIEQRKAALYA